MKTQMVTKQDTGTLINIITELENMKDIYLVYEKRQMGKSNQQKVLNIMNDLEFLRNLTSKLDTNVENKQKIEDTMSQTSEQILEQYEKANKTNKKINMMMLGTMALTILGGVFVSL